MAAVSDEHVAALRAHLAGDYDECDRLCALFGSVDAQGFNGLLAAAFIASVHRRFGGQRSTADIVRFVAAVRTRFVDEAADEIDPSSAERLIKVALGAALYDEDLDDTARELQIPLLSELIADERLDANGLEEFLGEARKLAEQWTN
jgi:hypothetical protein